MGAVQYELGLLVVSTALAAAFLAQWLLGGRRPRRVTWAPIDNAGERVVFLFQDDALVDATPHARSLLSAGPEGLEGWPRLLAVLERRFPGCGAALADLGERQRIAMPAAKGPGALVAEWRGGLTRIALTEGARTDDGEEMDGFSLVALGEEVETLRRITSEAPLPIWREDADGAVRWANAAYLDLARRICGDATLSWPLPRLFTLSDTSPERRAITPSGADVPLWFEIHGRASEEGHLRFALPADRLVSAETALSVFVQTLTKTFADLTTGLAIFDKERRLALFNPALADLTTLDPVFLSGRPTLFDVLDQLRAKQRMPEPKDYKSWRRQIGALEAAAAAASHTETWTLPSGQTFRITGRPHPDGAVAFLFEDISAEITATRRYRAELELSQSVLDSLTDAIAVISATGKVILTNAAYDSLWDCAASQAVGEVGLADVCDRWASLCAPSEIWAELRDRILRARERQTWSARLRHVSGRVLSCRIAPLPGQATMVTFRDMPDEPRARITLEPLAETAIG